EGDGGAVSGGRDGGAGIAGQVGVGDGKGDRAFGVARGQGAAGRPGGAGGVGHRGGGTGKGHSRRADGFSRGKGDRHRVAGLRQRGVGIVGSDRDVAQARRNRVDQHAAGIGGGEVKVGVDGVGGPDRAAVE